MPLLSKSQHRVRVSLIWESPRVSSKGRWYELAQQKLSRKEAEDKLDWLLFERSQHLKAHRMAYNLDAFGGVFAASMEIIEDLLKVKWGRAARGVVSLVNRKANLMKLEMEGPNKEIHYLVKLREKFD
jgi:hypothetical protein